jgi:hypothetical protein
MRRLVAHAIAVPMALALCLGGTGTATACDEAVWSEASNGLRARLILRRAYVSNGTGIVVTHLEVNHLEGGTPMLVAVNLERVTYSVTDADDRSVPKAGLPFSGGSVGKLGMVLPGDSTMRFRVGPQGFGIPGDQAALVDLGPDFGWSLPRDGRAYYLQGVLDIPEVKADLGERRWHGRLVLPRVLIPTRAEPLDPATLGPRIDALGAKMLAEDTRLSEAAARDLSLIDDPRVVPWYVKAVKTDDYDLKCKALDRLGRLEGDAALEGLKVGMATQGDDIGNCRTPAVAGSCAENIRHAAAGALARSPHPKAKALLLSMEEDPAMAVRLTVLQAAARMEGKESLALLKRRTRDGDATVRSEAARLLETRVKSESK